MVSRADAQELLRAAMGRPAADFRDGQWEAIDHIVNRRGKVLCIQRTGWGKSMVYFVSAKLMRQQGHGVTLIISPLLALMRNQLEAAARMGLTALTINSTNKQDWSAIRADLLEDSVDLLLISPERLANDGFVTQTLQPIAARIGLVVVDEAHCISDWGHDFRPDYRRIGGILSALPRNIAVLGTTATANQRVQDDVAAQFGDGVQVQRGPLLRESLALQVVHMTGPAERLAWLAERIPQIPGSGIIYTLTVRDAERVAQWLRSRGIDAHSYYAHQNSDESDEEDVVEKGEIRATLEHRLLNNDLQCLVATNALGMGYDKPDLTYVIHYQTPGNVIAYYQQVGRAGRAIPKALGVMLCGKEDGEINAHFRNKAFPDEEEVQQILSALEQAENGLTLSEIERAVNMRRSQIEKVLKLLVVEPSSPVLRVDKKWNRTPNPFKLDQDRIDHLTRQRETEWEQMLAYQAGHGCYMQFLARALDDAESPPCGRCTFCQGTPPLPETWKRETLIDAQRFVRHSEMPLKPKKQWDSTALPVYRERYGWSGTKIPQGLRAEPGYILSRWAEPVWGEMVSDGKAVGVFPDELAAAAVDLIRQRWTEAAGVTWVTCIPSTRHPTLVPDFARKVAEWLGVPFHGAISTVRETEPQKTMENRYHQCRNLDGAFEVDIGAGMEGAVLLVDDVIDSGWTLALAAALLRQAGTGPVFPFALATSSSR